MSVTYLFYFNHKHGNIALILKHLEEVQSFDDKIQIYVCN